MKVTGRRKAAALLAAAALLLIMKAVPGRAEGVTRCLAVGYDRFVTMPPTGPASANNVRAMAGLLEDFLPEGTRITTSVNGPGTAAGLEQLAREAFAENGEEDTALLYLSTHGAERPETPGGMALILSDGEEEEELTPEALREMLDRIPGKKILIVDACRSGALIGKGTEEGTDFFDDDRYRVLVSGGSEEESWFWSAETDEYTGTGYFTEALENALRASDEGQIDPDGSGEVSLEEVTARLGEIHGASTVYCRPEGSGEPLFSLPEDRKAGSRLRGIEISPAAADGEALAVPIRFRAEEPVRIMYQLVPSRNGRWDFEHAVRLPDRERTGLTRGLLSPGEKERTIRMSRKSLGEEGKALLQIISLHGEVQLPAAEAARVIEILPEGQEKTEAE